MKKVFLFLILLTSFAFSAIDERKTDIFFGNGVLTDREAAKHNAFKVLEPAIIDTFGPDYYNQHIGKVAYAYNSTHLWGFGDLIESALQKLDVQSLVDAFLLWKAAIRTSHSTDLQIQVKAYTNSIAAGHKVLVVAHSQGNLFAADAYNKLPGWMQPYFEAVSVASPMSADIKYGTSRIDWDNDIVPRIATLGAVLPKMASCKVRNVEWESNNPFGVGKPDSDFVRKSDINATIGKTYHYTARENGVNSKVHAFTFYMGDVLKDGESPILNPFTGKPLSDQSAKTKIMNAIDTKLRLLESVPSQWKKSADIGCPSSCAHRIRVEHKFDAALDANMSGVDVLPFDATAKLYEVNATYVKGNRAGTGINEIKDGTICYELDGTSQKIPGKDINNTAKKGALEITLTWDNNDSDYNLTVGENANGEPLGGTIDLQTCNTEHYYVKDEYAILPGTYPVGIIPDKENRVGI